MSASDESIRSASPTDASSSLPHTSATVRQNIVLTPLPPLRNSSISSLSLPNSSLSTLPLAGPLKAKVVLPPTIASTGKKNKEQQEVVEIEDDEVQRASAQVVTPIRSPTHKYALSSPSTVGSNRLSPSAAMVTGVDHSENNPFAVQTDVAGESATTLASTHVWYSTPATGTNGTDPPIRIHPSSSPRSSSASSVGKELIVKKSSSHLDDTSNSDLLTSFAELEAKLHTLERSNIRLQRLCVFFLVLILVSVSFGAWFVHTRQQKITSSQLAVGSVESSTLGAQSVTSEKLSVEVSSTLEVANKLNSTIQSFGSSGEEIVNADGTTSVKSVQGVNFGKSSCDFLLTRPPALPSEGTTTTILKGQDSSGGGGENALGGALTLQAGIGKREVIQLQTHLPVQSSGGGSRRRRLLASDQDKKSSSSSSKRFDGVEVEPVTVLSITSAGDSSAVSVTASNASIITDGVGSTLSLYAQSGNVLIAAFANNDTSSSDSSASSSISIITVRGGGSESSVSAHQNGHGCDDYNHFPSLTTLQGGCKQKDTDSGTGADTEGDSTPVNNSTQTNNEYGNGSGDDIDSHPSSSSSSSISNVTSNVIIASADGASFTAEGIVLIGSKSADTLILAPQGQLLVNASTIHLCSTSASDHIHIHTSHADTKVIIQQKIHIDSEGSIHHINHIQAEEGDIQQLRLKSVEHTLHTLSASTQAWFSYLPLPTSSSPRCNFGSQHLLVSVNASFIWLPTLPPDSSPAHVSTLHLHLPADSHFYWYLLAPAGTTINTHSYWLLPPAVRMIHCKITTQSTNYICQAIFKNGRIHEGDDEDEEGYRSQFVALWLENESLKAASSAQLDLIRQLDAKLTLLSTTLSSHMSAVESEPNSLNGRVDALERADVISSALLSATTAAADSASITASTATASIALLDGRLKLLESTSATTVSTLNSTTALANTANMNANSALTTINGVVSVVNVMDGRLDALEAVDVATTSLLTSTTATANSASTIGTTAASNLVLLGIRVTNLETAATTTIATLGTTTSTANTASTNANSALSSISNLLTDVASLSSLTGSSTLVSTLLSHNQLLSTITYTYYAWIVFPVSGACYVHQSGPSSTVPWITCSKIDAGWGYVYWAPGIFTVLPTCLVSPTPEVSNNVVASAHLNEISLTGAYLSAAWEGDPSTRGLVKSPDNIHIMCVKA